jgi:hypothetical protein
LASFSFIITNLTNVSRITTFIFGI